VVFTTSADGLKLFAKEEFEPDNSTAFVLQAPHCDDYRFND
jgi:hypothetical protein